MTIIQQLDAGLTSTGNAKIAWVKYNTDGQKEAIEIMNNSGIHPDNWSGVELPTLMISSRQFADLKNEAKYMK